MVFAFGEWRLDPVAKVLFRNGEAVHVTRKAVETLLVLVENAGRVVTKEEMISAIWGGRVVDEANLAQNIAVIRKVLSAPGGSPAYIETFAGRGYRLEGPVVMQGRPYDPGSGSTTPLTDHAGVSIPWLRLAAGAAVIIIGVLLLGRRKSPVDSVLRVVPATRLRGKEYQPAITADGSRIAFLSVDDAVNPPSVWIQDLAGGTPVPVSRRGGHQSSPAWSPDGSNLLFCASTGPEANWWSRRSTTRPSRFAATGSATSTYP